MAILENLLTPQLVQRLGWTLIHFVWQAAIVAVALAMMLKLARKLSARLRYIIACAALMLVVLLPVITIHLVSSSALTPPRDIDVSPSPGFASATAADRAPGTFTAEKAENRAPAVPLLSDQTESAARASVVPAVSWRERLVGSLEPALPYVVLGWLVGVFGLSVWHLGGWAQLQRLKRRMVKEVEVSLQNKLKELAELLGIRRAMQLMESALVQVPTVVGWLKPVILLPASALTGLTGEQLEAVLAHELAHIRRLDYLVNMLQTAVEILGFYHPAVWWVSHKIRVERENCCDDLAVKVCGDKVSYAKALTQLEEIRGGRPVLAVAAGGGGLLDRIYRLVGAASREERRYSWLPAIIVVLLILALAIPTTLALTARSDEKADVEPGVEEESGILAWQRTDTYVPPSPETFFPDDVEGGRKLDELFDAVDKDTRSDEEILETVRRGFRRTSKHRTLVLAWIGSRYIWHKKPQHPEFIEIMYHAVPMERHYAVYYGLSVVGHKTPNILRTLADICMQGEDVGRITWGTRSQRDELVAYIEQYLEDNDPNKREMADILVQHFRGKLDFEKWKRERSLEQKRSEFGDRLGEFRQKLLAGDSQARREVLRLIRSDNIGELLDDSFLEVMKACGEDNDVEVRRDVARIAGSRWVWSGEENQEAIELMLKLSRDEDRDTRYKAVYHGLSTVRNKTEAVVRRLVELALSDHESNLYGRIVWGLTSPMRAEPRLMEQALQEQVEQDKTDSRRIASLYFLYKDLLNEEPPESWGLAKAAEQYPGDMFLVIFSAREPDKYENADDLWAQFKASLPDGIQAERLPPLDPRKRLVIHAKVRGASARDAVKESIEGNPRLRFGQVAPLSPQMQLYLEELEVYLKSERPDAAEVESSSSAGSKFTAVLSNGVTVELMGVCEHPSEGKQWWRPDGSMLKEAPYDKIDTPSLNIVKMVNSSRGGVLREFAIRMVNLPEDTSPMKWVVVQSHMSAFGEEPIRNARAVPDVRAIIASTLKEDQMVRIRLGIACGPWRTISSGLPDRDNSFGTEDGQGSFSNINQIDGGCMLTVADTFVELAQRTIAVGKSARVYLPSHSQEQVIEKTRVTSVGFENLALDKIEKFQFQIRPFEWVEFKNVSLKPAAKTEVEVEIVGAAPGALGQTELPKEVEKTDEKTRRKQIEQRLQALEEHRRRVQRDLDAAERSLEDVRAASGLTGLENAAHQHPITLKRNQMELERDKLILELKQLEAQLRNLQDRSHEYMSEEAERQINNDRVVSTLKMHLVDLENALALKLAKYGKDHEEVRKSEEAIEAIKERVRSRKTEIAEQIRRANLLTAQDQLIVLRSRLEEVEKLRTEAEAKQKELEAARAQYERRLALRDERSRMLDAIKEQIEKLKIIYSDPEAPGTAEDVDKTVSKSQERPEDRGLSRKEIEAKLANLENQRVRVQRELDMAEEGLRELREATGFSDLEQRSYPHPVTQRLIRLERESDDCALEIAQLRARIENLEKQADTPEGKANLKKAQDDYVVLSSKLEELQRMCSEARTQKKDLDSARSQYQRRLALRDERQRMLDSIKAEITRLRILHDDPDTPSGEEGAGRR